MGGVVLQWDDLWGLLTKFLGFPWRRLKSYVDELEKEREECRAVSEKLPWLEATVAELEKAVEQAAIMRQKASEVYKTEVCQTIQLTGKSMSNNNNYIAAVMEYQ
jgi:hypothetical protein